MQANNTTLRFNLAYVTVHIFLFVDEFVAKLDLAKKKMKEVIDLHSHLMQVLDELQ